MSETGKNIIMGKRKRNKIEFDSKGKAINFLQEKADQEETCTQDENDTSLSQDEITDLMEKRHKDIDEEAEIMRALKEGNGDLYGF